LPWMSRLPLWRLRRMRQLLHFLGRVPPMLRGRAFSSH